MAVQTRGDVTVRGFHLGGDAILTDSATFSQVSSATSGNVTDTTSYPVADQTGLTEKFTFDGGTEQTVTFGTATTALLIAAFINDQVTGGSATVTGGQVVVSSDSTGVSSSVAIGTGTTALAWATAVAGTGGEGVADYTVVAQNPATRSWVVLTDVTATDGTEFPRGIYAGGGITAAALEAGDVDDAVVITGGSRFTFDEDLMVFQGTVALTDEITNQNITVRAALNSLGMFPKATDFQTSLENA